MVWDPDANKLHPARHAATMVFSSDTIDLRDGTSITSIPYYAFRYLKKGMHNLELTISQHTFRSNHSTEVPFYDSVFRHPSARQIYHHAEQRMVFAKVLFRLHVPAIHETILYMNRIDLRNDSTYSPYGSDNALWKSSLPDLYWEVLYPANNRYAASAYETSTMEYTTPDTVNLYHYSTMDTVGFEVMDHDMLSRDDGMGYAYYSLRDIIKRKRLNTAFGNVKLFSIRTDYKGIVNR